MSVATHILIFPYPAQGHMLAMLDFAHQLSLHGITLTILVTPKNLPILEPLLSCHPSIQTLILPFPDYPTLTKGVENLQHIGNKGNLAVMNALGMLHSPIVQWFKDHPNPPAAIISDFFLGWTQHMAHELKIPRISFHSTSACLIAIFNSFWKDVKGALSLPVVKFHDVPKTPTFTNEHLPTVCRRYTESDPEWDFVKDSMIANMSSYWCIINSFDALESEYLAHLRTKLGHSRVWGIGPLIGQPDVDKCLGGDLSAWLDRCPDGSVLFVCFGSQKLLKKDQVDALANALEKSQTRFVWVMKPLTAEQEEMGYGSAPDGFEKRVSNQGLVIKEWAPQRQILNHKAVGGFLSHCGWNSTLEGIVAGVIMLAWPMEADQFVNARLLVEDVESAVQVCEGADSVPDSSDLAWRIAEAMTFGTVQKANAEKMKEKALKAVQKDGSSWVDMANLVMDLSKINASVCI